MHPHNDPETAIDHRADKLLWDMRARIEENLTAIENRNDLSVEQKATRIIHLFSATCAGVAIQPIPFADIFVLTAIQSYMAERLAAIRGVPLTQAKALDTLFDLAKVVGLGMTAQQIVLGLYKIGLPGLAGFTTIPLVYGATYGIGHALDYMFDRRAKNRRVDPEQIREIFRQKRKKGRREGKRHKEEIKATAEGGSNVEASGNSLSEKEHR